MDLDKELQGKKAEKKREDRGRTLTKSYKKKREKKREDRGRTLTTQLSPASSEPYTSEPLATGSIVMAVIRCPM